MSTFNTTNGNVDACEFNPALQAIFLVLSLFALLLLNVPFAIIAIMHKSLHQKNTMITLVLTIFNICYSVFYNIPSIASVASGQWPFGEPFCYASGTMINLSASRDTHSY